MGAKQFAATSTSTLTAALSCGFNVRPPRSQDLDFISSSSRTKILKTLIFTASL